MAQTLLISCVVTVMVLNSSFIVANADEPKADENTPLEDAPPGVPMVPESRKFGHHHEKSRVSPSQAPEGAKAQAHAHHGDDEEHATSTSETTSISDEHGHGPSSEVVHVKEEVHHHHLDGSVAGGGIIIAGLATAFVTAIFCYIRATRRTRQILMNKEQLI